MYRSLTYAATTSSSTRFALQPYTYDKFPHYSLAICGAVQWSESLNYGSLCDYFSSFHVSKPGQIPEIIKRQTLSCSGRVVSYFGCL